ncbi:MAG: M28 family peptidase [Candidatus Hodarchaeales archaeon]|jgi:hypothetical protein
MSRSRIFIPVILFLIFLTSIFTQLGTSNERLEYLGLENLVSKLAEKLNNPDELDYELEYKQYVEHLANNIGPRESGSIANIEANQWIKSTLASNISKRISINNVGFTNNTIGYLQGDIEPVYQFTKPTIVFLAHYDTSEYSPGANADASGVAALLLLANIITDLPYKLHFDTFFVFTNAVPSGAIEVANFFAQTPSNKILCVINIEMLLYGEPVLYYPKSSGSYFAQSIAVMNHNYKSGIITAAAGEPNDGLKFGTVPRDDMVFDARSIPTVIAIDNKPFYFNPYYLDVGDIPDADGYNYTNPVELVHSMALAMVDWSISLEEMDNFHYYTFKIGKNETVYVASESSDNVMNFYFTCVADEVCAINISRSSFFDDDDRYANKIMQNPYTGMIFNNDDSNNFWSKYPVGGNAYAITPLNDTVNLIVVIGLDADFDLFVDRMTDIYFHIFFTKYDINPPRVRGTRRADDTTTTYRYETSRTVFTYDTDTTSSYDEKGTAQSFTLSLVIFSLLTIFIIGRRNRKK